MKRNRKREPLHFGTVARNLLACICAAAIGLGYVWQKTQIQRLGDEIKKREAALAAAEKRNVMLAARLAEYKSPAYLEAKCRQYNLNLLAPREQQMVRLYEPGAEWDKPIALPPIRPQTTPAAHPKTRQVARR
jgi:cell division protein FtsB